MFTAVLKHSEVCVCVLSCLFNHNRINQREALVVFAYKDIHSFNAARTYTCLLPCISKRHKQTAIYLCTLHNYSLFLYINHDNILVYSVLKKK